ncbi:MAG TPA: PKD domain-containing protein [Solirubrobacteraceae bacterium]|jgi:hypothetical protein
MAVMSVGSPAGAAEPTWVAPETLRSSPAGGNFLPAPAVALADSGEAAALWMHRDPADSSKAQPFVSVRPPGGPWGPAEPLGAPGNSATGTLDFQRLVATASGDFVGVWLETGVLRRVERPAGGAWSEPQDVSVPAGHYPQFPRLGAADDGTVTLAYADLDPSTGKALITTQERAADRTWGDAAPVELPFTGVRDLDLDVAPNGRAIVAAMRMVSAADHGPRVATRGADGNWSALSPIADTGDGNDTSTVGAAIDDAGDAVVAWNEFVNDVFSGQFGPGRIWAARHPAAAGAWPADGERISQNSDDAYNPVAAESADGAPWVAWSATGGTVRAARYSTTFAFWQQQVIGIGALPRLAVMPDGGVLALFRGTEVRSARASAAGTWGEQEALTEGDPADSSGGHNVAVDGSGNSVAGWSKTDDPSSPTAFSARAAGLDAEPPVIVASGGSTLGTVGVPVPFSAAAFDVWGPLAVEWAYGDGQTGPANSEHLYQSPGSVTATVTATDAAGFTDAESHTIEIAGAPPPGAPPPQTPSPNPPPATPPLPPLSLVLAGGQLRVDARGRVRVRVTCPATAVGRCRGTLRLVLAGPAARAAATTLGRATLNVPSGRTARVAVRLSRAARRLLRRRRTLEARVRATGRDDRGATFTAARRLKIVGRRQVSAA